MGMNSILKNEKYIAAATIDGATGDLAVGDNSNSLAIADLQFVTSSFAQWDYSLGEDPSSQSLTSTLDEYFYVTG